MDRAAWEAKKNELETELARGERLLKQQQAATTQTERTLLRIQGALSLLAELEPKQGEPND